jgi:hypothetical protein
MFLEILRGIIRSIIQKAGFDFVLVRIKKIEDRLHINISREIELLIFMSPLLIIPGFIIYNITVYGQPAKVAQMYYDALFQRDYDRAVSMLARTDRKFKYKRELISGKRPTFGTADVGFENKIKVKISDIKVRDNVTHLLLHITGPEYDGLEQIDLIKELGRWRITYGWDRLFQVRYEKEVLGQTPR